MILMQTLILVQILVLILTNFNANINTNTTTVLILKLILAYPAWHADDPDFNKYYQCQKRVIRILILIYYTYTVD